MENAFSGAVTLASANKGSASDTTKKDKAFSVTYTLIPKASCIELATKDWGHGKSSGLYSIQINNTVVYSVDSTTEGVADQVSVTEALSGCSSPENNTIIWTFY